MMKSNFYHLLFLAFISCLPTAQAQLANGSIAPNVTFTDINGNTHDLYTILDGGQSVIFDAFATWCGICWNYDNTGILKNIYQDYGPGGTNEVLVFAIEASPSTNQQCLYGPGGGCTGGSIGDWVTNTPYPTVHIDGANEPLFNSMYQIPGYPTLYKICPNKKIYHVGQAATQTWINWISSCSLAGEGTASDAICFNDGNGGVDLNVNGGFGNITYEWNNGATTQDLTNAAPGTYNVTITEGQGHAIEVGPFVVDGPSTALTTTLGNQGDLDCAGDGNGFILMNTSGGAGGYSYQWSSGQTVEDIFNLNGGIYSLSVTDNLGCLETFTTQVFEPAAINLNLQSTAENCNQQDGSITVSASGGTGPYFYDIGSGATSNNVFSNLSAGNYGLMMTDANGCTEVESIVVQGIPGPSVSISPASILNCFVNDIQLNATASSSGAPATYGWTTADGNIVSGANSLTPIVDLPGTYTLVVTDPSNGCTASESVAVIGDTAPPTASAGPDGELNCLQSTYVLNGSASSSGSNISYEWFNENNVVLGNDATLEVNLSGVFTIEVTNTLNGCTSQSSAIVTSNVLSPIAVVSGIGELNCTTSSIVLDGGASGGSNLAYNWLNNIGETISTNSTVSINQPGLYFLLVTDMTNGCEDMEQFAIAENTNAPTADAGSDVEINCFNSTATVGGNSSTGAMIDYSWTNEGGTEVGTNENLTTGVPGIYTLTVTNLDNGCTSSSAVVITENIAEPVANAGNDATLDCDILSVSIGGNSSTGAVFSYEWMDGAGLSIGTTPTITVSTPDTYIIYVTNTDNGCVASDMVVVSENVNLPSANAGADQQLDCTAAVVELNGGGSSQGANISYSWVNANGSIVGSVSSIEVATAGAYTLIVTNNDNGCTDTDLAIVTASTDFPTATAAASSDLDCTVSVVMLSGNGSSSGSDFSYQWTDASGNVLSTDINTSVNESGAYTFQVTNNSNGCVASSQVEVVENVNIPTVDISASSENFDCETTSITLSAITNASTNISAYSWINELGQVISTDMTVVILEPGTIILEVVDGDNGCNNETSLVITGDVNLPTADAGAGGELTCSINSVTLGGNSSTGSQFDYSWMDANGDIIGTNSTLEVSIPGSYTLEVENTNNGCVAEDQVIVTQNSTLPNADAGNDAELDCATAVVELDGSGSATGNNISYSWENANGTQIGTNINQEVSAAGTYTLIVTNEDSGCSDSDLVVVTGSTDFPTSIASADGEINCNTNQVILSGQGSSTGTNFEYIWVDENSTVIGTNIDASVNSVGTYYLTVLNSDNNCSATASVVVGDNFTLPIPVVEVAGVFDCSSSQVTLDATASQGNSLMYEWFDELGQSLGSSATLILNNPGEVVLQLTNGENGCEQSWTQTIEETQIAVDIIAVEDVHCFGAATGFALASPIGGVPGSFEYLWSYGNMTETASALAAGVYSVTITDENGCTAANTVEISQPTQIELAVQTTGETGEDLNDGTASASASGGTGSYTYNWSTNETGSSISNLAPGQYMLTVTDANQCSSVEVFTINSVDCQLQISTTSEDIDCFGNANGSIILEVTAGDAASFSWSNNANTASIDGLTPGTYSFTVTDGGSCSIMGQQEITEPVVLSGSISNVVNISCGVGQGGSATVIPGGGTAPYSYNWSSGETTTTATQLVAGMNIVNIEDANGCTLELPITITADDNEPPVAIAQNLNIDLDDTGNASINAGMINNGSTDNCGIASIGLDQNNFDCTDVGTQEVLLIVTDLSGNETSAVAQVTINDVHEPELICPTAFSQSECNIISYDLPQVIDNCDNYELTLLAGFASGSAFPEGNTDIVYRVTDPSGNTTTCSFMVTLDFDLDAAVEAEDARCAGEASGTAMATPSGGQPGYQYLWSNGQQTATANGLEAGDHSVLITDDQGCTVEIPFEIDEPTALEFVLEDLQDDATGMGTGSIDISVSGGIQPYTYVWTLNGIFHSTDQDIDNLSAGNYGVEIIDANGCEFSQFGLNIQDLVPTQESQYANVISLQPNPTRDITYLEFELAESKSVVLEWYSTTGQFLSKKDLGSLREKVIPLDLQNMASGVYHLRIIVEDEVLVKQVVLQK